MSFVTVLDNVASSAIESGVRREMSLAEKDLEGPMTADAYREMAIHVLFKWMKVYSDEFEVFQKSTDGNGDDSNGGIDLFQWIKDGPAGGS